jgi:hypothetical protein
MAQRKPKPVPQHLVSSRPTRSQCGQCRRAVLVCHVYGEPTVLDPCHINALGEAMCLVAGGRTYEIPAIGRERAIRRTVYLIGQGLPQYGHVHPSHICGLTWDAPEYHDRRHLFGVPYTGSVPPF